uniref:Tc1-like transposase DDE domain-containing protein n=1 Tax=Scylla olivacea TaxID=85551 RepID=A0A0P4VUG2_SCYOL
MMTGEWYMQVLEDHIVLFYELHGCNMFMHDGAPCHRAKKVMQCLKNHNIRVLDWSRNSPDLNFTENCWSYMKNCLTDCSTSSIQCLTRNKKKVVVLQYGQRILQESC